jgi:phosphonate dehydrogenase
MRHRNERPLVVITQKVHREVIEYLGQTCRVWPNDGSEPLDKSTLLSWAAQADALMVFMPDRIDEAFLQQCPRLKVIGAALKGYDNFDVEACSRRGIWFTIVPELLTIPTAELIVGLMIALARNLLPGDELIRSGAFQGWRPQFYGKGLNGSTAGIIGLGAVGRALAQRLKAFDMKIIYNDVSPLPDDEASRLGVVHATLEELLKKSDYVIPLVPLTRETRHLIDRRKLTLMKPGGFLINAGRGSIADERAVAEALQEGRLAGYAADVFEVEDWALSDRPPAIDPQLRSMREKTVFSPHLGSAVRAVRLEIEMEAARNILEALNGQTPRGAVNRPF